MSCMQAYDSHVRFVVMEERMRQPVLAVATAFFGGGAVLLGAFGAHALAGTLDTRHLDIWQTAVRFQFWHALALAVLALSARCGRAHGIAAVAFGIGMLLFCGSLYALALGAPRMFGLVTPFGGVALVAGWVALGVAVAGFRRSPGY